jgi:hypothetical protein
VLVWRIPGQRAFHDATANMAKAGLATVDAHLFMSSAVTGWARRENTPVPQRLSLEDNHRWRLRRAEIAALGMIAVDPMNFEQTPHLVRRADAGKHPSHLSVVTPLLHSWRL